MLDVGAPAAGCLLLRLLLLVQEVQLGQRYTDALPAEGVPDMPDSATQAPHAVCSFDAAHDSVRVKLGGQCCLRAGWCRRKGAELQELLPWVDFRAIAQGRVTKHRHLLMAAEKRGVLQASMAIHSSFST
eukprot:1138957-Pelagomonas_calceolata.AAC.6